MTARLFYEDAYLKTCEARVVRSNERGIVLDRTVFYPLGGGQPADVGSLHTSDGRTFSVTDVRKGAVAGEVLHLVPGAMLQEGEGVVVDIDWDKRHCHMRMHTCLHLLSAVIPAGVTGGSVRYDSGRLDFDLPDQALDRGRIEEKLNELVAAAHPVTARWVSEEELADRPDWVKTMSVKPPMGAGRVRLLQIGDVDLQACGGTHVANTAEIGRIQVVKVENKGAHNRRVTVAFAPGQ
jgi:misacylated tRNA(Ala) deacylase